jgi:predicted esterase
VTRSGERIPGLMLNLKGMSDIADRTFSARLDCHYLLLAPPVVDSQTLLVVALHGFGANAETMLKLTARLFETPPVIASPQGPNQFFLGAANREVGYGWITSRRPAESIRLHHDMVLHVADEAGCEFGVPAERRLLVGFSQSVGLNYRLAATHPDAVRGVIGICGGLPGDWDDGPYKPVTAAVLHIARRADQYYPPSVTEQYSERLRRRAADVEFHLIDGGHQMPSSGSRIVEPWLRRILK